MRGKIINFKQEKLFGFIMGEDGKNYFFHTTDVDKPLDITNNMMLTFTPSSNKKGLCAKKILLKKVQNKQQQNKHKRVNTPSKPKKQNFIQIGNFTVKITDIKSARIKYFEKKHFTERGQRYCPEDTIGWILNINTYQNGLLKNYYTLKFEECRLGVLFSDDENLTICKEKTKKRAQKDLDRILSQLN